MPMKTTFMRSASRTARGSAAPPRPTSRARPRPPRRGRPAPRARRGRPAAAPAPPAAAAGSPGGTASAAPWSDGHLGEAAHRGGHDRLAERQRGAQHARLVDPAVGEGHDVGAAEVGGQLGVVHEPLHEPHAAAGRARAAACSGGHVHVGQAHHPQLRARRSPGRPPAARRRPCTGAPGRSRGSPGPPPRASSGGRGASSGRRVRWSNAPWGITCTRSGSAPKRSTSSVAPARACTTSASMRRTSRRVTGSRSPSPRRRVLCTVSTRGRAGGSSSESSASSVSHW